MENKKRSKAMRVAGGMLAASLVMTCLISGTMAKYTSTASGADTARVAKWSIDVNGTEIATGKPAAIDINLFESVADTAPFTSEEYTDDADVNNADEGETAIIAPGTMGDISLEITNKSEVTANFDIKLTEKNEFGIPILYSFGEADSWHTYADLESKVKNTYDGDWGKMLAALSDRGSQDAFDKVATDETIKVPIYWTWAYDTEKDVEGNYVQTDERDTGLGIGAQTGTIPVTITAEVTATQAN